ncbi:MAG TPA: hypothetical protein VGB50_10300 [Flavobacterium sp.]|jgi:hypothetical protein
MKTFFFPKGLLWVALTLFIACAQQKEEPFRPAAASFATIVEPEQQTEAAPTAGGDGEVYICKSAGAKKYHYDENCHGLRRCKHTIEKTTRKAAEGLGLGLCGYED